MSAPATIPARSAADARVTRKCLIRTIHAWHCGSSRLSACPSWRGRASTSAVSIRRGRTPDQKFPAANAAVNAGTRTDRGPTKITARLAPKALPAYRSCNVRGLPMRNSDINYFVYISDSKVEMLYEQIPWEGRKRLSYELGIDFGIVKAKFSSVRNTIAQMTKIKIIEKYISRRTGTVISPRSYFRGEMDMIWGPYWQSEEEYENVVYFGGEFMGAHVGLGGTITNCLGISQNVGENITSFSLSSYLLSALARGREIPDPRRKYSKNYRLSDVQERALCAVVLANQSLVYPKQRMKFLAKRFLHGSVDARMVVIGSPIYVVQAD